MKIDSDSCTNYAIKSVPPHSGLNIFSNNPSHSPFFVPLEIEMSTSSVLLKSP